MQTFSRDESFIASGVTNTALFNPPVLLCCKVITLKADNK